MSVPNSQSPRALRRTFLLLDPYDSYGIAIARYALDRLGIRPIALFSDAAMRAYFRRTFPEIESDLFEDRINLEGRDIVTVARALAERYDIVGVAPYLEYHLEQLAPVVDALELPFNSAAVLARCRDKHALKSALAKRGVAVPKTRAVRNLDEATDAQAAFGRFVLKPNAGYSNQNVGFFDRQTDRLTLAKHLSLGRSFVAEEYVGGQEFSLNGQIDEDGTPHLLSIFTGERTFANGRESVYRHAWQLRTSDPRFTPLADYAAEVVQNLDLVRIPFHLEVRLADDGSPRLVDVGARLIGNELAFMLGRLHGGRLDAIELACRGYLGLDCAPRALDWDAYDAKTFIRVYGISSREEIIATLDGVDDVEALPAFVRWVKKPAIGQKVTRTLDLNTLPFAVDLLVDGDEKDGRALAHRVEESLRWNQPAPSFAEKARAERAHFIQRVKPRATMTLQAIATGTNVRPTLPPHADEERPQVPASPAPEPATPSTSFRETLKQGLKRNLWPALSHVVKREPEPPLQNWGLSVSNDGRLLYQDVDIADLAQAHGSPLYVVLDEKLRRNARAYQSAKGGAKIEVGFSYKTNPVPGLCARLHELGIGAECISPYELWLALQLGTPPDRIIYGGPAKSDASLELAIEKGIRLLNINHPEEIERVERAARKVGKKPRVGLRVTPPGGWSGQFGAAIDNGEAMAMFERALASDVLDVAGLHVHRGMLLRDEATIDGYLDAVLRFATTLVTEVGVDLRDLDVGGSLAIPTVASYSALDRRLSQTFLAEPAAPNPDATLSIEAYVQKVATKTEAAFASRGLSVPTVLLEPGRSLTGNAQLLLTSVITTKRGREGPPHAVLDGGINIAEPAQFEYHRAVCAGRATAPPTDAWRLVGPACTPGDVLFSAWPGPDLDEGDVIAIMDAGAYFVPFSTTFSFPRPGIVTIEDGAVRALRRPETFDDLVMRDGPAFSSP